MSVFVEFLFTSGPSLQAPCCGKSRKASPGSIASKLSTLYGLQRDDRTAWK